MSKNIWNNWKLWLVTIIILITLIIGIAISIYVKNNKTQETTNIQLGDIITLTEEQKTLLRNKTIANIQEYLKAPSTAQFQENFIYTCTEPNIIKVDGYVDSQNSFGAMIREKFTCQYFAIKNDITTLILLIYDNKELLNIKETYIEEYKKQIKLDNINQFGKELNQEKLEYIKEEFNNDKLNDVGNITNVMFNEKESNIDVQVIAKSSQNNKEQREYWSNFNICSILHYFNNFNIIGTIKINLYDIDNNKILELKFDDDFIKNKWKDNSQINKVKELFGGNYKEII